jgi:uncharacterized cupredoxin-like copper-binding protein
VWAVADQGSGITSKELAMSTNIEDRTEQATDDLASELHDLEVQEEALERRTRSLEFAGPLALVFSFVAMALGIGALIVALNNDGSGTPPAATGNAPAASGSIMGTSSSSQAGMGMGSKAGGAMMMGAGGHGKFTAAQVAAAKHGTVYVQLGDIWVAPTVPSVKSGKVVFKANNVGKLEHELMVERMPMKFDAPMQPNEDAAQGMIPDMDGGGHGQMTMRLKPGRYMLFCNVQGHYAAGQHIPFTVTKS